MNLNLVQRLVRKDLYIHRWPLLGLGAGVPALALALAVLGGTDWNHVGMILMTNSLIWLSFFMPLATISKENKPFIFSLPVSPAEYTASKILGGLLVFLPVWTLYVALMPVVVDGHPALQRGAVTPAVVLMGLLLLTFFLTTSATLVFESLAATLGVGFLSVVLVFAFLPMLRLVPERILAHWASDRVVWDVEVIGLLAVIGLVSVATVIGAFAILERRRSWI